MQRDPYDRRHLAIFKEKKEVGKDTYEFFFQMEDAFSYQPGQYVWLELLNADPAVPGGNRRAMSLASLPDGSGLLSMIFRIGKTAFKRLALELEPGAEVMIEGPFGSSFLFPDDEATPLVLIAGGVGVAPFIALMRAAIDSGSSRKITIICSDDSPERMPCHNDLRDVIKRSATITSHVFYRKLEKGDLGAVEDLSKALVYVAGPSGMVDYTVDLLRSIGVKDDQMRFEANYPSARHGSIGELIDAAYHRNPEWSPEYIFRAALEDSSNHSIITDTNGYIVFANRAARQITGYSFEEMKDRTPRLWGGLMSKEFYQDMWKKLAAGQIFHGEIVNRRKSGEPYYTLAHISPIFGPEGTVVGFIGTEEDVTMQKMAERELEEASRMESEFISIASHQLRTPMTAIKWVIERFTKKEQMSPKGKEYLNDIHTSVNSLTALVDLLLNVSRIEGGEVSISPQAMDVVGFLRSYFTECAPLCEKKNIKFTFTASDETIQAVTDTTALRNIIQSILSNAIEYTPQDGSITASIKKEKDTFLLTVQDTGIGIPPEEQGGIGQKFSRASNAKLIKADGTGLGVFIAYQAANLLGGRIWFESELGKGTTFFVRLPLRSEGKEGKKSLA
ncbi:PAS domain S-box protein [Patescibacteria group bacterium]|nr:PAS domain S-box protein [Patescibacteria group bacterium]